MRKRCCVWSKVKTCGRRAATRKLSPGTPLPLPALRWERPKLDRSVISSLLLCITRKKAYSRASQPM